MQRFMPSTIVDRKQESGHRYTVFIDSTSAIDGIRSDALGPSQGFAVTSIEVCGHFMVRNNEVTVERLRGSVNGSEGR